VVYDVCPILIGEYCNWKGRVRNISIGSGCTCTLKQDRYLYAWKPMTHGNVERNMLGCHGVPMLYGIMHDMLHTIRTIMDDKNTLVYNPGVLYHGPLKVT
jgi:hypothetical protein